MIPRLLLSAFVGAVLLLFAADAGAQERTPGTTSQPLTIKKVRNWTENGNVVPVCWETSGYDREKLIIKEAVTGTWEWHSTIRFTGWAACPTGGSAMHVRIRLRPQDDSNAGAGGSAELGMDALSSAVDNDPGMNLSINPDGTAEKGRVEYIGVHEFGHVLGFIHEQDTPGNVEGPAYCKSSGNEANSSSLTAYDRDSVMNYCNRDGNAKGNLTDIDVAGVQAVYGVRVPNISSRNSCVSALFKPTASVSWAWNDGSNQTSIAVFRSDRTKFLERAAWSSRDGGWGDDVKWFAGDFNGDGRTELGAAWNNGGSNTLTVREPVSGRFNATHWAVNAGGWSATAVWLPGDFNNDGRIDVAGAWNDSGQTSIAVYVSDGTKFLAPTQWSLRDGGWGDTVKWFAGDFDGDGRTDIGSAWNNNGAITLTVRLSTGRGFRPVHWTPTAGNWSDSAVFVAGDFNADGRTDVARLWNDLGRNSTAVSLSDGTRFREPSDWGVRDGGWIQGNAVKWTAGDFNGDGRTDIGAAWNDDNLNTLTVRQSTGSGFRPVHWAIRKGGWRDSAAWCAGQFNALDLTLEARAVESTATGLDRVTRPATGAVPPRSICEAARSARARNSPAAPGLEAQCRAAGAAGEAPVDVEPLAAQGEAIASAGPLAFELRTREPNDAGRRGFDIGMAAAEGHTAPGPGKDRIRDSLPPDERGGFNNAVAFSLERNRHVALAINGAAIAVSDPLVARARIVDPDVFYWLGFDIATGIFGDPALGALGNTATGPGSLRIRDSLGAAGRRGFNASVTLHLSRNYRR